MAKQKQEENENSSKRQKVVPHFDLQELPEEMVVKICQTMTTEALENFVQSSSRHLRICDNVLKAKWKETTDAIFFIIRDVRKNHPDKKLSIAFGTRRERYTSAINISNNGRELKKLLQDYIDYPKYILMVTPVSGDEHADLVKEIKDMTSQKNLKCGEMPHKHLVGNYYIGRT